MSDIVNVRSTIAANGGVVVIRTGGMPVVGIELEGTWVGTLHLQETVSGDGFVDAQVTNAAGTPVSAVITSNGKFFVAAAGRSAIRVIATAWTSGTATVVGVPTAGSAGGSSGGGGGAITAVQLPAALGSTTAANSLPVTLATDGQFVTSIGSLTEAAPANDTASSGLNGRLQRVAQNITSSIASLATLIAKFPAALVGGRLDVNVGATGITQPVSAAALPLPAGASTETTLAAASAKLPAALVGARFDVNLGAAPATVTVQGAAAAGAAVAGNPVLLGASDGTNAQNALCDNQKNLLVAIRGVNSASAANVATPADPLANTSGLAVVSQQQLFNATGWDRARNNVDVTLLASAARTTTQPGSNITAYNCQAIAVTLDVTAITSTCSLTVTIGYVDPASGKVINLLTSAVIAAVSTTMLLVDPRVVAAANLVAMKPIGRVFVITVTVGNANSQTYSVGYTLIPC